MDLCHLNWSSWSCVWAWRGILESSVSTWHCMRTAFLLPKHVYSRGIGNIYPDGVYTTGDSLSFAVRSEELVSGQTPSLLLVLWPYLLEQRHPLLACSLHCVSWVGSSGTMWVKMYSVFFVQFAGSIKWIWPWGLSHFTGVRPLRSLLEGFKATVWQWAFPPWPGHCQALSDHLLHLFSESWESAFKKKKKIFLKPTCPYSKLTKAVNDVFMFIYPGLDIPVAFCF